MKLLQVLSAFVLLVLIGFVIAGDNKKSNEVSVGNKDTSSGTLNTSEDSDKDLKKDIPKIKGTLSPAALKMAIKYDRIYSLNKTDLINGDANANILLVEYSDLQCPFCEQAHPIFGQVVGKDVAWIYRHLPIESIHPQAHTGAVIAECVKEYAGNKLAWQYIDVVFKSKNMISEKIFKDVAKQVANLTDTQISVCLQNGSIQMKQVDQHKADSRFLGINGTPGGFIFNRKTGKSLVLYGLKKKEELENMIQNIR